MSDETYISLLLNGLYAAENSDPPPPAPRGTHTAGTPEGTHRLSSRSTASLARDGAPDAAVRRVRTRRNFIEGISASVPVLPPIDSRVRAEASHRGGPLVWGGSTPLRSVAARLTAPGRDLGARRSARSEDGTGHEGPQRVCGHSSCRRGATRAGESPGVGPGRDVKRKGGARSGNANPQFSNYSTKYSLIAKSE